MYHIVFKSSKHVSGPSYYAPRKVNKASTHNQFELDVIRSAMKARWELHGYGTLDIQKTIWEAQDKIHLSHLQQVKRMLGHIITVDTPTDVMWFRLNHENVSKNRCKMTEIYKGLNEALINEEYQKIKELHTLHSSAHTVNISVSSSANYLDRFATNTTVRATKAFEKKSAMLAKSVRELANSYSAHVDKLKGELVDSGKVLFAHLDACRTEIA